MSVKNTHEYQCNDTDNGKRAEGDITDNPRRSAGDQVNIGIEEANTAGN